MRLEEQDYDNSSFDYLNLVHEKRPFRDTLPKRNENDDINLLDEEQTQQIPDLIIEEIKGLVSIRETEKEYSATHEEDDNSLSAEESYTADIHDHLPRTSEARSYDGSEKGRNQQKKDGSNIKIRLGTQG